MCVCVCVGKFQRVCVYFNRKGQPCPLLKPTFVQFYYSSLHQTTHTHTHTHTHTTHTPHTEDRLSSEVKRICSKTADAWTHTWIHRNAHMQIHTNRYMRIHTNTHTHTHTIRPHSHMCVRSEEHTSALQSHLNLV